MQPFEPTQPDHRHRGSGLPAGTPVDFRSSTLQPDPDDPAAWLRRPVAPATARPDWLLPALVCTVLMLTLAAAAWEWLLG